mgnify:CR=1 FL=1
MTLYTQIQAVNRGLQAGACLALAALIEIVFGLSIAFAATSFFLTFFSFGGGALI